MSLPIKESLFFIIDNGIQDGLNIELARKIRLINIFCLIGVVFVFPISVQSFWLGHYLIFTLDMLAMAIFMASFFYLGKTSEFKMASHVFVNALFFLLLFFAYSGGVDGTGAVWIFIFPIVALSLYEPRLGMMYTILFTLVLFVLFFFPTRSLGTFDYPIEFRIRIFCSYFVVTILAMVYEYYRRDTFLKMQELSDQLDIMSKHDSLTGLMNRRGIYDRLEHEQARILRTKTSFSIILGDIDQFKIINDQYGHDAGDQVLKIIPKVFSAHTRAQDIVARWGGEEFLFLLPETDCKGAYILGEKVRKAVQAMVVEYCGQSIETTMSFGVVEIPPDSSHEEGIIRADHYLLKAKAAGRNRVLPVPEIRNLPEQMG